MSEKTDRKSFLEDIGFSLIAITFWAAACYGLVYLFPSASWIWVIFGIYAALTLLEALFDFGATKIVRWILKPKPRGKGADSGETQISVAIAAIIVAFLGLLAFGAAFLSGFFFAGITLLMVGAIFGRTGGSSYDFGVPSLLRLICPIHTRLAAMPPNKALHGASWLSVTALASATAAPDTGRKLA